MESEWIQIRLFLLRIPHFPIQASDDTPQEGTSERKISRLQKIRGARPRRSSQKPVTKQPAETTSSSSTWHADSWDRPIRSANGAAKAITWCLRSLTSALALPLYHSQLLDALFRLACNRPRNFTIGAVGSLRFKRRDNAITQHIDARFSRPATQSH